jgi:hypothetical protein
VQDGALDGIDSFNKQQVEDEVLKREFLAANPELTQSLHRLEDHHLLRGSIGAFELEPKKFDARSDAFYRLAAEPESWLDATGALLAVGEYQQTTNNRKFQFGTGSKRFENAWRELLTGADREALSPTRSALAKLLDAINDGDDLKLTLAAVQSEWLAQRESELYFDWRYYLVKYSAMREGGSGIYYSQGGLARARSIAGTAIHTSSQFGVISVTRTTSMTRGSLDMRQFRDGCDSGAVGWGFAQSPQGLNCHGQSRVISRSFTIRSGASSVRRRPASSSSNRWMGLTRLTASRSELTLSGGFLTRDFDRQVHRAFESRLEVRLGAAPAGLRTSGPIWTRQRGPQSSSVNANC